MSKPKIFRAPRLNRDFEIRRVPCPNPKYSRILCIDVESTSPVGGGHETFRDAQAAILSDFGMTDAQVAYNLKHVFNPDNIANYKRRLAEKQS